MSLSRFGRLQVASGLSNLADGVFQIALPLVTLNITRDPALFASVSLAMGLPWLLFALPAGAIADRTDRRVVMLSVNIARAVLIAGLAVGVSFQAATLWVLAVTAFVLGVGETLFDTSSQSILPNIVPADQLEKANGRLYAIELVLNQFVGPPLGGLLVAVGAAFALGTASVAYLLAGVAMAMIAGSFKPTRVGEPTALWADIIEGVRYLWTNRTLRVLAMLTGIANLTGTAAFTILPLYAVAPGPMGLSEAGFGLFFAVASVGSLAGSFVAAPVERLLGRWGALMVCFAFFIPGAGVAALTSSPYVIGLVFALYGVASVVWNVITVAIRQRITPDAMLGRVNGGYRLLAWGVRPVGVALGGWSASAFGLRAAFAIAGVLTVVGIPLLATIRTSLSQGDFGPTIEP